MNAKTVNIPVTRFVAILQEATIVCAGQDTTWMVTYGLAKVSHLHQKRESIENASDAVNEEKTCGVTVDSGGHKIDKYPIQ